ncbi:DUF4367 domain-containing protein [Alicyclobacillus herbarius]|uniref:DUF4367 domain-containing protein n=1 Tax=Alicyclobacillus herbarius TaxID=122960 RepID=UPI000413CC4B|nr:DUF4367 domain-containing protein [Alicyclobacillus herbarius]
MNRLNGVLAGVAGMVVFGAVIGCGVPDRSQDNETKNISASSNQAYDYKNKLGFQPLLPDHVPGYKLKWTVVRTYIGNPSSYTGSSSPSYNFEAKYTGSKPFLMVLERKQDGYFPSDGLVGKYTYHGTTVYETKVDLDGMYYYAFQMKRDGVWYEVSAGTKSSKLSDQLKNRMKETLFQLNQPVTSPPLNTETVITGLKDIVRYLPFKPVLPTVIPAGYQQTEADAYILTGRMPSAKNLDQLSGDPEPWNGDIVLPRTGSEKRLHITYSPKDDKNVVWMEIQERVGRHNPTADHLNLKKMTVNGQEIRISNDSKHNFYAYWYDKKRNITVTLDTTQPIDQAQAMKMVDSMLSND